MDDAGVNVPQAVSSPEALVDRRGAPSTIYALAEGALWSINGTEIAVVVEGNVAAYAASPGGDNVAVVTVDSPDPPEVTYSITIHSPDGQVSQRFDDVLSTSKVASPVADDVAPRADIDISWAAQGDRLLLTHPAGHMVDVPLDGEARTIETRSSIAGAVQAEWSPRGDSIGVVLRDDTGRGELALIVPGDQPAGVTVIAPVGGSPEPPGSVELFVWKANGSGVFFLEARRTGDGLGRGTVIGWDRESNSTSIVATGGQAGPAGSITWFSVSPDGRAIIYRVALPTDDGWRFNGLFIRSLDTGQVYRVPVQPEATVEEAWWFAEGLVWSQSESSPESTRLTIRLINASGEQTQIASYVLETLATPGASPVSGATPATPIASPVATPSASPQATPE